jgi:general secretion pathway protein D
MKRREVTRSISPLYLSILVVAFTLFCISCAWKKDFRQGQEAFERKDWDQAVAYFLKAVGEKPDSVELRISLANALISASSHYLQKGKQFQEAEQLKPALIAFDKALEYNPENNEARRRKHNLLKHLKELEKQQREKTEIQQLKEKAAAEDLPVPQVEYKEKPYSLKFARADLQQVFKALEKASGVSFIFDESFKSKRIAVNLENVGFMEALEKIMLQTNLFYKVVDPHTVMIIPDTPAKRRDYEELVMRTMFISNGNPDEILKTVRALTGMKTAATDKDLNSITFKGTPAEVKMAERIARIHDKPKGEVFIDIEIIEVNRTRVREYGIELSQYSVTESYLPETGTGTEAAASTIRLHRLGHTDASDYLLTLPSINYKLLKTDRNSNIKARPQLRVVDGQKVEVRLGDKIPIPTTSFVPYNVGAPNQQPITSYQLQDVGINIELKPQIHHDGLISLEMKFELTFITNPGTERIPPTIGNRSVTTLIKLRDNETSILAGLLRDTERKSLRGFPFLSQVPILKEIFSGNTNEIEQTDIILTLTPRIIRFPEIDESDLELLWVGTQAKPGLKPAPVQLELPAEVEEPRETEKKTSKKEPGKTTPKTPASKPPAPPTEPQPKPLSMFFLAAGLNIKKDIEADVSLAISGDHDIKAVTLEMDFDPALVQVLDVRKGKVLNNASVKSLLLRNIDNQAGKLKLNISLEQPLKITPEGTGELMVLRVKPLGKGKVSFKAVLVRVLDAGMNKIESECPDKGMEFQVSE